MYFKLELSFRLFASGYRLIQPQYHVTTFKRAARLVFRLCIRASRTFIRLPRIM
jgi:hypothetical protein